MIQIRIKERAFRTKIGLTIRFVLVLCIKID